MFARYITEKKTDEFTLFYHELIAWNREVRIAKGKLGEGSLPRD